jgi:hypothetical protein
LAAFLRVARYAQRNDPWGRDRRLKFLQIGFEKMVGDDQRLDGLAGITAAGRDGLIPIVDWALTTSGKPPRRSVTASWAEMSPG